MWPSDYVQICTIVICWNFDLCTSFFSINIPVISVCFFLIVNITYRWLNGHSAFLTYSFLTLLHGHWDHQKTIFLKYQRPEQNVTVTEHSWMRHPSSGTVSLRKSETQTLFLPLSPSLRLICSRRASCAIEHYLENAQYKCLLYCIVLYYWIVSKPSVAVGVVVSILTLCVRGVGLIPGLATDRKSVV